MYTLCFQLCGRKVFTTFMNKRNARFEALKQREEHKRKLADSLWNVRLIKLYNTENTEIDKYLNQLKIHQVFSASHSS